ncbi:MAG: hypothetical protein JW871_04470 [Endomicrobiales bacterium]|nr:hypothetical protein [Endomicrobiales bacterium]
MIRNKTTDHRLQTTCHIKIQENILKIFNIGFLSWPIVYGLLSLVLLSVQAAQPGVVIQNSVDKNKITIGENLNYDITFIYPENYNIQVPKETPKMELWEINDFSSTEEKDKERQILKLNLSITTFTTGQVSIPELAFKYTNDKNEENEVKTQPIKISVESLITKYGDSGDIRDIKPPLYLRIAYFVYLIWVLAAAILFYGFYFWYKKYQKRKISEFPAQEKPGIPPMQLALGELDKLRNSDLVQEGRIKEFYIALTNIIRDYLSGVYSIETRDRTTSEIYADLRQKVSDKKYLVLIRDFFNECDLVKFAKYRPDEKACFEDLEAAVKIVQTM